MNTCNTFRTLPHHFLLAMVLLVASAAHTQAEESELQIRDLAPPAQPVNPPLLEPLLPEAPAQAAPPAAVPAPPVELPAAIPAGIVPVISVPTEGTIVRLPPSAFPDLPKPVKTFLEQRGITIPQSFQHGEPHNVVQGYLRDVNRPDWAVLASLNGRSSILIFWRGSVEDVSEIATSPDSGWLQNLNGDGVQVYSRYLDIASPEKIRLYHESFGGPQPPVLDHEGINDYFLEKASTVWYWHKDKWLELQGMD